MSNIAQEIIVDGVKYTRAISPPSGTRVVLVVDRGWIFAGDLTVKNGRLYLDRAVWILRWDSIGFDGVLKDPKSNKVSLKKLDHTIDVPESCELFRVAVTDNWGL